MKKKIPDTEMNKRTNKRPNKRKNKGEKISTQGNGGKKFPPKFEKYEIQFSYKVGLGFMHVGPKIVRVRNSDAKFLGPHKKNLTSQKTGENSLWKTTVIG